MAHHPAAYGCGDVSAHECAGPSIDYFQSQGYRFVPNGELMWKTRAKICPCHPEEMRWQRMRVSVDAKILFH